MAKSSSSKKSPKKAAATPPAPEPEVLLPASAKTSTKLKTSLQKAADLGTKLQPAVPAAPPAETSAPPAPLKSKSKAVKVSLSKPAAKPKKAPAVKAQNESTPSAPAAEDAPSSAKRILFITAECTPLAQTGGLGDAVAGLTKALVKRGHDVRIVMPLYGRIDRARYGITFSRSCCVHFGRGEEIWVGIFEGKLDGQVPIWFIDYERYFGGHAIYAGDGRLLSFRWS